MKYVPLLIITCLTILSCAHRKEYKAEEYLKKQATYEKRKKELLATKGQYFRDNRAALSKMVVLVDQVADTTRNDHDINADTTFFMEEVEMVPVNFGVRIHRGQAAQKDNLPKAKAIFLTRKKTQLPEDLFGDPLKELRNCFSTGTDIECLKLKEDRLTSLLALKYAFMVEELLVINPVLKEREFDGGLYLANITCYDLEKNAPVLRFQASATSSDEVKASRIGMSNEQMIQNDFELNVKNSILASCKKHFMFDDRIQFVSVGF